MRIAERVARLERQEGEHPRITAEEMRQAAARFEGILRRDGVPFGCGTVDGELAGWRQIVENCDPWARRVYLNSDPMDLYV